MTDSNTLHQRKYTVDCHVTVEVEANDEVMAAQLAAAQLTVAGFSDAVAVNIHETNADIDTDTEDEDYDSPFTDPDD